ncbi:hypothetical protein GOV13_01720 [Candidatus Pacearchaeota archaeon]|nr:hypothetical protein [Candidatus Pacearchaeota archaeon]
MATINIRDLEIGISYNLRELFGEGFPDEKREYFGPSWGNIARPAFGEMVVEDGKKCVVVSSIGPTTLDVSCSFFHDKMMGGKPFSFENVRKHYWANSLTQEQRNLALQ